MNGRTISVVLASLAALAAIVTVIAGAVIFQQEHPSEASQVFVKTGLIVGATLVAALVLAGIILRWHDLIYLLPKVLRVGAYLVGGVIVAALTVGCVVFAIRFVTGTKTHGTPTPSASNSSVSFSAPTRPTGNILYQDPLTANPMGWSNNRQCFSRQDGMHVMAGWICYAPAGVQSDVDVTADVTQLSGSTEYGYGLAFRVAAVPGPSEWYELDIASNQAWGVFRCSQESCKPVVNWISTTSVNGGLNAVNSLEVLATGSQFVFSINGAVVGHAHDTAIAAGYVGISCGGSSSGECLFDNMVIKRPGVDSIVNIYASKLMTPNLVGWQKDQNCSVATTGLYAKGGFGCDIPAGIMYDSDITVQVSQIAGSTSDSFGTAVRYNSITNDYYEFDINSNQQWTFYECVGNNCATLRTIVNWTTNTAILGGHGSRNTLEVLAEGTHFSFFVNNIGVGSADDSALVAGSAFLDDNSKDNECLFTNLVVTRPD